MNVAHEAACTVAALIHLAAVGVEDAVIEVRSGCVRRLYYQQLVEPDTEVAMRQLADGCRLKTQRLAGGIDDHEVVARALHFCELESHVALGEWRDAPGIQGIELLRRYTRLDDDRLVTWQSTPLLACFVV